ncbi:unnamed protein product, partial [Prorocentrum cordatum]
RFPPEEKEEEEEGRGGGGGGREPRGLVERCAPRAAPPGGALLRGWWPPPRNREATPQGSRDASSGGVTAPTSQTCCSAFLHRRRLRIAFRCGFTTPFCQCNSDVHGFSLSLFLCQCSSAAKRGGVQEGGAQVMTGGMRAAQLKPAPPAVGRGWASPGAAPRAALDMAGRGRKEPLNNNSLRLTASRALARQGRGANHTVVIWSGHGGTQGAQRAAALQRTEATRCSANPCMYRGLHGSNNKDLSVPHPCALLRPSACAREPNKKVSTTRSPHNAYSTSHPIPSIGTIHLAHGNRNCYPGGPRTPCFWGCSASLRT